MKYTSSLPLAIIIAVAFITVSTDAKLRHVLSDTMEGVDSSASSADIPRKLSKSTKAPTFKSTKAPTVKAAKSANGDPPGDARCSGKGQFDSCGGGHEACICLSTSDSDASFACIVIQGSGGDCSSGPSACPVGEVCVFFGTFFCLKSCTS